MSSPSIKPEAKTAVLVFHGMGQQVPYETMANLAFSIAQHWPEAEPGAKPESTFTVESVPRLEGSLSAAGTRVSDGGIMARVRLDVKEGDGAPVAVDFLESYWAPIPQGKVGLIDSVAFLLNAGWDGIKLSWSGTFERVFWNSARAFKLRAGWNLLSLAFAAGFISSLFIFGLILVFLLLSHALQHLGLALLAGEANPQGKDWNLIARMFDRNLFRILQGEILFLLRCILFLLIVPGTALMARAWLKGGGFLKAVTTLGMAFLLYHLAAAFFISAGGRNRESWGLFFHASGLSTLQAWIFLALIFLQAAVFLFFAVRTPEPWFRKALNRTLWHHIFFFLVLAPSLALAVAVSFWRHWGFHGEWKWEGFFSAASMTTRNTPASQVLIVIYGACGLAGLWILRYFLIQYAGDVAAYVNFHKVGKFNEIRGKIQDDACKAIRHVYASGYDNIILVAHSLGSVIAYDAYNRIVTEWALSHPERKTPAERTKLFLTFGSPLNKIAFIFRSQVKENGVRELLAAAKQPLLEEDHAYRPAMWVNVWSRNDIISGPLDLYDQGDIQPKEQAGWPAREFQFFQKTRVPIFSEPGLSGAVELGSKPVGQICRPIIPLIDPDADLPIAAHNQYWGNKLIHQVIIAALQGKAIKVEPAA